jgi:DNA-binding IscR family transcriptional regulator
MSVALCRRSLKPGAAIYVSEGQTVKAFLKRDLRVLRFLNEQAGEHSLETVAKSVGLNLKMANSALTRLRKDQFVARVRDKENGNKWSVIR